MSPFNKEGSVVGLCSSKDTNCITDLWHVLLALALRGGTDYLGGLMAKYSVAVRICFRSLQRWTETLELELEEGEKDPVSQRLSNCKQAVLF